MDTGTGDHQRRDNAVDKETTNNVLYVTNEFSVQELLDKSKDFLTKTYGKKEGVDFLVSFLSWVYLQLSTLCENRKTAKKYTGRITCKRMLLLHTDIYSAHPHAHWMSVLNKY